jgi:hypothetical protein
VMPKRIRIGHDRQAPGPDLIQDIGSVPLVTLAALKKLRVCRVMFLPVSNSRKLSNQAFLVWRHFVIL